MRSKSDGELLGYIAIGKYFVGPYGDTMVRFMLTNVILGEGARAMYIYIYNYSFLGPFA